MATVYRAREYEETSIPIAALLRGAELDIYPDVLNQKFFELRFRGTNIFISAGKYVGYIPLNENVVLYVEPKIPVDNLAYLLATAATPLRLLTQERTYGLSIQTAPSILEALAAVLLRDLEAIEVEGLLKAYILRREASSLLRGQIRFHESVQASWSRGKHHAAVSVFYELSPDIPANQLILFACEALLRYLRVARAGESIVIRLVHCCDLLGGAGVSPRLSRLTRNDLSSLPLIYQRAAQTAELIALGRGLTWSPEQEAIALPSIVLDMETLFEGFVRNGLREKLKGYGVSGGGRRLQTSFRRRRRSAGHAGPVVEAGRAPVRGCGREV